MKLNVRSDNKPGNNIKLTRRGENKLARANDKWATNTNPSCDST